MSAIHHQHLASIKDITDVYAYGYGGLSELCHRVAEGVMEPAQLRVVFQELDAAVKLRLAELEAEEARVRLMADSSRTYRVPALPAPDTTPIYVSDENAAERSNEE